MAKKRNRAIPYALKPPRTDPAVREVARIISTMTPKELSEQSGLSISTAKRLLSEKTHRPQNLTIERMLFAAGFTRQIVRRKTNQ